MHLKRYKTIYYWNTESLAKYHLHPHTFLMLVYRSCTNTVWIMEILNWVGILASFWLTDLFSCFLVICNSYHLLSFSFVSSKWFILINIFFCDVILTVSRSLFYKIHIFILTFLNTTGIRDKILASKIDLNPHKMLNFRPF